MKRKKEQIEGKTESCQPRKNFWRGKNISRICGEILLKTLTNLSKKVVGSELDIKLGQLTEEWLDAVFIKLKKKISCRPRWNTSGNTAERAIQNENLRLQNRLTTRVVFLSWSSRNVCQTVQQGKNEAKTKYWINIYRESGSSWNISQWSPLTQNLSAYLHVCLSVLHSLVPPISFVFFPPISVSLVPDICSLVVYTLRRVAEKLLLIVHRLTLCVCLLPFLIIGWPCSSFSGLISSVSVFYTSRAESVIPAQICFDLIWTTLTINPQLHTHINLSA